MNFGNYADDHLRDYEAELYDREVAGEDTWELRDAVLWEMNRRGMMEHQT
jgi:hypothetical protein